MDKGKRVVGFVGKHTQVIKLVKKWRIAPRRLIEEITEQRNTRPKKFWEQEISFSKKIN